MNPNLVTVPGCNEPDAPALYGGQDRHLMALAAIAKVRDADRIEEIARFAAAAGWKHIGIACCVLVNKEAKRLAKRLAQRLGEHFRITRVDCKICLIAAEALVPGAQGISCSPIGQALILATECTDLNIAMGLCFGHDLLFARHSQAPVTTLIVKDRRHGNNPATALI